MAQLVPEWAIDEEAETMLKQVVELHPDKFGHIQCEAIGVAMIVNKPAPKSADWDSKLIGITDPQALYSPKRYIIWMHKDTWDEMTPAQRSVELVANLQRIPDPMDGTILKQDLKDSKALVRGWGVDYKDNPNLPNFAEAKQVF